MKITSEENDYMRISPINISLKNNSLQSSISKEFTINTGSNENIISPKPFIINQTLKNLGKYMNIINFPNVKNKIDFSTISSSNNHLECDRGKYTSTIFRGKYNFNPIIKKTFYQTIRYKPKNATNFPSLKLKLFGNKPFYHSGDIDIAKPINKLKIENKVKSCDNILDLYRERMDENIINRDIAISDKKVIKFKSEQIKFFSKVSCDYSIFKKFINFISERNKLTLNLYLTKLTDLIERQRNELFIDNINYNYLETPENQPLTTSKNEGYKGKKRVNIVEKKVHNLFSNQTIFKFLNINMEYNTILNKCFDLVFNELKELKEKNMELLKSNYENDILLNGKIKELKEFEKYLNLSQTKAFISNNKKKESLEKQLNSKYVEKENKYKIDLYKLNYEMRDLLLILERNKGYYDKYKEIEQREKKNNSENSYMKVHLSNELEKKNTQYKNEKELNNDLNEEILHLEKIINDLKNKNEELKMEQIQFDAKIKRLFGIINERNENIRMMNEELNYYSTMYYKEIKSHDATKILLLEYKKKLK
jgi:hypothetical protein